LEQRIEACQTPGHSSEDQRLRQWPPEPPSIQIAITGLSPVQRLWAQLATVVDRFTTGRNTGLQGLSLN
jgi:hypothetical protein